MSRSFEQLAGVLGGYRGVVVSLDPGETTGYAVFRDYRLVSAGQFPSGHLSLAWNNMIRLIGGLQGDAWEGWEIDPRAEYLRAPVEYVNVSDVTAMGREDLHGFPHQLRPHFVIEDYRVYSFKLDTHKFSNVYTIKVLTTYELLASLIGSPTKLTLAQAAKTFCTDTKLQEWGFWLPGLRHARDAIRHATYYIMEEALKRQQQTQTKPTFSN